MCAFLLYGTYFCVSLTAVMVTKLIDLIIKIESVSSCRKIYELIWVHEGVVSQPYNRFFMAIDFFYKSFLYLFWPEIRGRNSYERNQMCKIWGALKLSWLKY